MTSARRISSVLAVAAAFSCLGASAASAAPAAGPLGPPINPVTELDSLAATGLPEDQAAQLPGISEQLGGLDRIHDLQQLHQLTDLAAPVTGVLPAVSV
ncbi:hypothetical protein [Streptomyces bikiniensis]|uniref:Secreted protein n=1 Tax=Streptomyces bikiniensis TaxID=1896 RepID=A0ABW8CQT1_STRBI|nr:hypothetical protein [Streptomyces bikiniensis]